MLVIGMKGNTQLSNWK